MSENVIKVGDLMRASVSGFVAGVKVPDFQSPRLGMLVRVPLAERGLTIYGVIYGMAIADDGLVRRTLTGAEVSPAIRADMRERRLVPIEIAVQAVGYEQDGQVYHLLPPQPPLSFDELYLCSPAEQVRFAPLGKFGYLRLLLGNRDLPLGDVLAAHVALMQAAHAVHGSSGWGQQAVQALITHLRDDHQRLMEVLIALNEVLPSGSALP